MNVPVSLRNVKPTGWWDDDKGDLTIHKISGGEEEEEEEEEESKKIKVKRKRKRQQSEESSERNQVL